MNDCKCDYTEKIVSHIQTNAGKCENRHKKQVFLK